MPKARPRGCATLASLLRLNHQQLLSNTTILMLPAAASIDPVHGIAVRLRAVDQDGQPVPGALLTLQTSDMTRALERQADERGLALMDATVLGDRASVEAKASKVDRPPGSTRFRLTASMRRDGSVQEHDIPLLRLAPEVSRAPITVSVLSTKGERLPDAEVRLAPRAPLRGTPAAARTNAEGSAVLPGGAPGTWTLKVRHGKFETDSSDIEMTSADAVHTVRLREKLAASEGQPGHRDGAGVGQERQRWPACANIESDGQVGPDHRRHRRKWPGEDRFSRPDGH